MMYRSTPHTTTGVSPTEMLFGRCIRTKLPQLQEFSDEDEVRDSESERQGVIETGERKQTVDAIQSPFTVVQKNGNSVLVKANGIQYSCEKVSRAT